MRETHAGDMVLDSAGVRKGTRVLTQVTVSALSPDNLPGDSDDVSLSSAFDGSERVPSPLTGRAREGFLIATFRAIEALRPGDMVFGHDGLSHRVLQVTAREYCGPMVAISTGACKDPLWLTGNHYVLCAKRTASYGANRSWRHVPYRHFERGRQMRKEMTIAERTLWKSLKGNQLGVKFRRQHPIGPYIVDFYSWEAGLVVEVDGDSHFSNESLNNDRERTQDLETLGLTVIRFTNAEIRQHLPEALEEIWRISTAVKPSEIHCREWRRADSLRPADVVFVAESLNPFSSPGQRAVPAVSASQRMHSFQSPFGQICRPELHGQPIRPPLSPRQRGEANSFPVDGEGRGGVRLMPREIVLLKKVDTSASVYTLEVEDSSSVITEMCAVRTDSRDISYEGK